MATTKQRQAIKEIKELAEDLEGMSFHNTNRWNYLYVIRCNEFYKIGIAWDIDNRLNSLQTGNPYELEIVYCVKLPNAKEIEGLLHKRFEQIEHFREWFKLHEDVDFEQAIMEIYGEIDNKAKSSLPQTP